ncbi:major facilitator superfamily domain-containing protein [Copromyces sp. CBS 386.78]|nr:major facilitator superfamily domain-containing protein [Copromyces sp. CBS 386.78]
MGLGILEDRVLEHVPGTTQYFDDPERPQYATDATHEHLKCDRSGPVPIVLVPQPTDDPNDPLNWPLWRRDLITLVLSITSVFATALGPILAADTVLLVSTLENVTFVKASLLTGYFLLGCGASAFLFVPSSRIWGKRHLFILGTILLIVTSVWTAASGSKSYTNFLWSRIFQGVAAAPFESLVNAAVGDLYFVHERGKRMAFTNLAVFGGAFFTPILVGKISNDMGWPWTFWFVAIFSGVCLPAIFLFCPETAYHRDPTPRFSAATKSDNHGLDQEQEPKEPKEHAAPSTDSTIAPDPVGTTKNQVNHTSTSTSTEAAHVDNTVPPKATFLQSLSLFNGRKSTDSFWKLTLRPLPLLLHPAFLWACLIQGLLIGWTVFIGVLMAFFFISVPLWWDEVQTGYAYTGAFVGALIGFAVAGGLSDWSARKMTKWNKGVYEPEFRLVLVIPQMVLGCAGLYGFGITLDGMLFGEYHYAVPLTFFGLEVAGMVIGAVAGSLYIVDAYRDLVIEGFTAMIVFKNFFSFALTFKAWPWLIQSSVKAETIFNALGSVQLVVCLLTVPLYIYGKRLRSFSYRHDILELCGLR